MREQRRKQSARGPHRDSGNVRAYRKPININLGIIFFAVIFIYLLLYFFTYVGQKKISGYQVVTGSLSVNSIYRGVAIREEKEFAADGAGYVNYYASEGLKSGCGNLVYTLDATGALAEILEDTDKGSLTDEELSSVKAEIKNFKNEYQTGDFSSVYGFSTDLNSLVSRYRTVNIMDNINALNQATGSSEVRLIRAETSGIVVYSHDGYENLTKDNVTLKDLDETEYVQKHYNSNELVASGDVVYKMVMSEDWYVAIEIDEAMANRLMDESYIQIRFLKTQNISWASCEIRYTGDGILLILGFNNSMITYATDRFVDVELMLDNETGLKIPNTAIEEKEFYLIPIAYVTKSGADTLGVMVESYDEEGKLIAVFKPIDVYYVTDSYYYVSEDDFEMGTYLIPQNALLPSEGLMDADEIRDAYEPKEEPSMGIISNEVSEGDTMMEDENGNMILVPGDANGNSEGTGSDSAGTSDVASPESDTSEPAGSETTLPEGQEGESQVPEWVGPNEGENNSPALDVEPVNPVPGQDASASDGQRFAISLTGTLIGVYNMNKGYADFRQITILYQNDEYAIVKPNTMYGLCEYDYIVLDASSVSDNDLIY